MYLSKRGMAKLSVFLIFLLQSLLTPSLFTRIGPSWGTYVAYATSVALILFVIFLSKKINTDRKLLAFVIGAWAFSVFLLLQSYLAEEGVKLSVIYSSLFILTSGISVLVLSGELWKTALKAIIYPVLAFCASGIVTGMLILAGFSLEALEVARWTGGFEGRTYIMYAPFSTGLQFTPHIIDLQLARLIGHMREPGILSLLIVFSFFGVEYFKWKHEWFAKTILFVGLLLTYSTAGMVAFVGSILYKYTVFNSLKIEISINNFKKVFVSIGIAFVSWLFIFSDTRFALMSKLEQGSGQSRTHDFMQTVDILGNAPIFGVGFPNEAVSGVAFVAAAGQVGIAGSILFLTILLFPVLYYMYYRDLRAAILLPILVGALFAQPLFDKSITYLTIGLMLALPRLTSNPK